MKQMAKEIKWKVTFSLQLEESILWHRVCEWYCDWIYNYWQWCTISVTPIRQTLIVKVIQYFTEKVELLNAKARCCRETHTKLYADHSPMSLSLLWTWKIVWLNVVEKVTFIQTTAWSQWHYLSGIFTSDLMTNTEQNPGYQPLIRHCSSCTGV